MAAEDQRPAGNLGPWRRRDRLRQEATRGTAEVAPDAPKGDLESPPHDPPRWTFWEIFSVVGLVCLAATPVAGVICLWVFVGAWAATGLLGVALASTAVWVRTYDDPGPREVARLRKVAEEMELPHIPDEVRRSRWVAHVRAVAILLLVAALALLTYSFSSMPL